MQRWLLWASISLGFLELELRASFWCYPSNTISPLLSCAWSPIGPPAVTNARMLEWATLTIQRELQAGHGPAFCRNISFSYSHNPHCHRELTVNYRVPQSGQKICPWGKETLVCILIPELASGKQEVVQMCSQNSVYVTAGARPVLQRKLHENSAPPPGPWVANLSPGKVSMPQFAYLWNVRLHLSCVE